MTTDAERLLALKRDNLARMKVAGLPDGYLAGFVERQRDLVLGLLARWLAKPVAPSPPAGPVAVIDRHNHLIVTVPGNTEERHNHLVAALSDAKREGIRPSGAGSWEMAKQSKLSSVELLHDAQGRPYWQGALLMPWRKAPSTPPMDLSGPRHYAREALRRLGYDTIGRVDWKTEFAGYDGKLVSFEDEARSPYEVPNPPWRVGDRVIGPGDRHGTVVAPCSNTLGNPGCDVRWDLVGQQKNERRHQARVGVEKLSPEGDPPPRVYTLKRLHKQHLSPRARRLVEEQFAALGLLKPYEPPVLRTDAALAAPAPTAPEPELSRRPMPTMPMLTPRERVLDFLFNSLEHEPSPQDAVRVLIGMGYPAAFAEDLITTWETERPDLRPGPMAQQGAAEELLDRVLLLRGVSLTTPEPAALAAAPAPALPSATAAPSSLVRRPDPVIFPWAGGSREAKRLTFDNEAAALAQHAAVGGAVGQHDGTYYWTDDPNYFLFTGIAPLLRNAPPGGAVPPPSPPQMVTAQKATLYGLNMLGEVIALEVKDLEYSPGGGGLTFHLPNKRKRRRWANADGFAVVLRGFGHPDFRGQGGARLRPQAFGVELARFLAQYPAEVLVDLRRAQDRPPADAVPAGKPRPLRLEHGEIAARVAKDPAYKNALANTPHNARIAMDAALVRVMLDLFRAGYKEEYRQYSDDPAYKKALGDEMFAATFKPPAAAPPKASEWAPRIATMIMQALDISQGEISPERVRAYQERDRESGITKADWDAAIRLLLNQRKISVFTDGTIRLPETDAEEMERLRHRAATLGSEFSYDGDDAPKQRPPVPPRPAAPPAPPGDEAAQVDRLRKMLDQDAL